MIGSSPPYYKGQNCLKDKDVSASYEQLMCFVIIFDDDNLHSPSSWMHPHFIRGNIDGLCQIKRKKGGSKISIIHDKAIPTPIVARTAKHHRRATLTTELMTFIPTSIPRRVTLPTHTELSSFVQHNHINMQSIDIAQQAPPTALPAERHCRCIAASCPSQHPMSLLTSHKMIWNMSLSTQKMIGNYPIGHVNRIPGVQQPLFFRPFACT